MLQGKWWGDINSIEDLRIDLCLKSGLSDSHDVFDDNLVNNTVKDIKLVPHLVGNEFNLNIYSLKHYHYLKSKLLAQKKFLSITRENKERHKEKMQSMRCSREDNSNAFCMKRFGFIPNIDESVEENKKMVLKQRTAAACFN